MWKCETIYLRVCNSTELAFSSAGKQKHIACVDFINQEFDQRPYVLSRLT